jgi:hypothetical protein
MSDALRLARTIDEATGGLAASADGRRLLFNQTRRVEADLMLVEGFR